MREVLARPSARLSQRACCLKKLFTCQGTPCRRGQTVTGSGTGRAFQLRTPSQLTTDIFSRKLGTAGEKISENLSTLLSESAPVFVPMLCPFTLQRTIILRIRGCSFRKISLSTFQRTEICRLLSMPVRKIFLREPVSAQVIFKTLRSDRACKAFGERGQEHSRPPARYRRPLPVHSAVRRLITLFVEPLHPARISGRDFFALRPPDDSIDEHSKKRYTVQVQLNIVGVLRSW